MMLRPRISYVVVVQTPCNTIPADGVLRRNTAHLRAEGKRRTLVSNLSWQMALSIARAHSYDFRDSAQKVTGSYTLASLMVASRVTERREFDNGWLLRVNCGTMSDITVTVLVRDDDVVYFYGISPREEIDRLLTGWTGRQAPMQITAEVVLNPKGDTPALFEGQFRQLPPPRSR